MDLIAQALKKRDTLKSDLERIEAFLSVAHELQGAEADPATQKTIEDKIADPVANTRNRRAPAGVGAETAAAAEQIVRATGRAMATRELLTPVRSYGIEVGGKDPIATLSARLGNDAKRDDAKMRLRGGKWHLIEWLNQANNEETADTPTKDASAASFFSNQEGGDRNGTTLA